MSVKLAALFQTEPAISIGSCCTLVFIWERIIKINHARFQYSTGSNTVHQLCTKCEWDLEQDSNCQWSGQDFLELYHGMYEFITSPQNVYTLMVSITGDGKRRLKLCSHIMSKCPCSSIHPSKFTFVSMVMGVLTGRMGQDPLHRLTHRHHRHNVKSLTG